MREIKFRAWVDNDHMIYLDQVRGKYDFEDGHVISFVVDGYEEFGAHERYEPRQMEIMQYSGLKDKNGKEIYEGDKVKRRIAQFVGENSYADFTCEVRWNGWTYALFLHDKQVWGLDPIVARECEVIGNIYESRIAE